MWSKYLVVAMALVAYAEGYSSGAPEGACQDMIPKHPVAPQSTPPPYTVVSSARELKAGSSNPVEVTIRGKDGSNTIGGILLQARQGDRIVGTFRIKNGDRFSQLLDCGTPGNAVTHKKHGPQDEGTQLSYEWTPPKDLKGEVRFRATVAYNGAVFWVGVESTPMKVVQ